MKKRSSSRDGPDDYPSLREQLIGLGERSFRKSHYPQLQQRLAELERFRALLDQSNDAIFLVEVPSGNLVDVNESACRQLGFSRKELLNLSLLDLVAPSTTEEFNEFLMDSQAGADMRKTILTVLHGYKKNEIPAEITLSSMNFSQVAYTVAVARDLTERILAREALLKSDERYRDLFEESPVGHFISTPEGRLLACNTAFARILGFSSKKEALKSDFSFPDSDIRAKEPFLSFLRVNEKVENYEMNLYRHDGSPVHLILNAVGTFDDSGQLVEIKGYLFDNTERRKLEEQFLQAQKMEAVGRLASGVAHDFNNLLTAIMGHTELILKSLSDDDPMHQRVEQIMKVGERAASLTRQLLVFSRKQPVQPETLSINDVIIDMESMLQRLIREDIELSSVLDPQLGNVMIDSGQVEQVLLNLVLNARDAIVDGGRISIETRNVDLDETYTRQLVGVEPGPYVMLSVSDSGRGMDEEILSHVFEPFFTTKTEEKGTGLGLATVYGIVKQNGGHISVYSESGLGTTFKIYLPRKPEGARALKPKAESESILEGSETVLLVEDEEIVRDLARESLLMRGYRVIEAHDGNEALEICNLHGTSIDVLVADVVMPEMGGCELAEHLIPLYPHLKVLYISGYPENSIMSEGVLGPGRRFLQKPFTPDELVREIREILDEPRRNKGGCYINTTTEQ